VTSRAATQEDGLAGASPRTVRVALRSEAVLIGWLAVAVVLTVAAHVSTLGRPFDHPHAWVSAHFSTMARAYAEHGVAALAGLPIQNNPPLGAQPDAYLHWPPLFPLVLHAVFTLFGESETVAASLMLAILLATCAVLRALVGTCHGRAAGLAAAFALLTLPATAIFGGLVAHLHLAILAMLVSLLAFLRATRATGDTTGDGLHRGWAALGLIAFGCAALTSWEPLCMGPGLLAAAWWRQRRVERHLALAYCLVGALAFASVIALYAVRAPALVAELWATVLYRSGLAGYAPPETGLYALFRKTDYAATPSRLDALWLVIRRSELIGQLPLVALGWVLVTGWTRRREPVGPPLVLFASLLAPWLLWFTIMFNHACQHEYEMAIAAPALAAAVGVSAASLLAMAQKASDRRAPAIRAVTLVLLPVALLLPMTLASARRSVGEQSARDLVRYAHAVREMTAPGAIVLVPFSSMLPVYYAERHVIRGIAGDGRVTEALPEIAALFPDAAAYLAIPPSHRDAFAASLRRYPVVAESESVVLLALSGRPPRATATRTMLTPGAGWPQR
jgi:4-amino-4-deoxy-L-arabinose transferase-like glycosyltransferase